MMEEIWKDIEGFEGLYQVSNFGRVRSVDHYVTQPNPHNGKPQQVLRRGKLLTFSIGSSGYYQAPLSKGNKKYKTMMRLILIYRTSLLFAPNHSFFLLVSAVQENLVLFENWLLSLVLSTCRTKMEQRLATTV
jgi:hypothetical protein